MKGRKHLWVCLVAALAAVVGARDFHEGWETAQIKDYTPSDTSFINGDEGFWLLADSVSQSSECGLPRNRAQILVQNGSRVLRLLSNRSFTNCADDIWIVLTKLDAFNADFAVPLTPTATIAFNETGELEDPRLHDGGANCLVPPCFDNVSLLLTDNNDNVLAYVLQRYPATVENVPNTNYGDTYREIFLDPRAGSYSRNLFSDFQRIRTFNPNGAQIVAIEFRVDKHGWAILDNLMIRSGSPAGSVPVHRFWSPVLSSHFYTASESERQTLVSIYPDVWTYEGVGFSALPENADAAASPVYRFWSPTFQAHFYTINTAERDNLINNYSSSWVFEGIAFYAFAEDARPTDSVAVYRFWSDVLGRHFYTASETERDSLIRNYPTIWTFEGIAWYAFRP